MREWVKLSAFYRNREKLQFLRLGSGVFLFLFVYRVRKTSATTMSVSDKALRRFKVGESYSALWKHFAGAILDTKAGKVLVSMYVITGSLR